MHGQHYDSQSGFDGQKLAHHIGPGHARHVDIEKKHVDILILYLVKGVKACARFTHNGYVILLFQKRSQSTPEDCVVICEKYANLHR